MAQVGSRKRARRTVARSSARKPKYAYSFAGGKAEGSSALRNLLGGKGCELTLFPTRRSSDLKSVV